MTIVEERSFSIRIHTNESIPAELFTHRYDLSGRAAREQRRRDRLERVGILQKCAVVCNKWCVKFELNPERTTVSKSPARRDRHQDTAIFGRPNRGSVCLGNVALRI